MKLIGCISVLIEQGTEKQYDHIWLGVNGEWLDQSNGRPTGRISHVDALLVERFSPQCPGNWKSNDIGRFTFDVLRNELFTVEFNLAMNYANDYMAITGLSIACAQRGLPEFGGAVVNDLDTVGTGDIRNGEAAEIMPEIEEIKISLRPVTLISFWVVAIAISMNICWAYWCGVMKGRRAAEDDSIAVAAQEYEGPDGGGSVSDDDGMKRYGVRYPIPPMSDKHIVPQPPPAIINLRV